MNQSLETSNLESRTRTKWQKSEGGDGLAAAGKSSPPSHPTTNPMKGLEGVPLTMLRSCLRMSLGTKVLYEFMRFPFMNLFSACA